MQKFNFKGFTEDFISEYVEQGFGLLGKRDFEVLVFHLLHKNDYFGPRINFFDVSKTLRISERKVRNYYEDVQLRYNQYTPEQAQEQFVRLFEQQHFEVQQQRYRFQIRDPLLRQYMEEWVDAVNGIMDSSFSPTLVVVSRDVLLDVLDRLMPDRKMDEIRKSLPREVAEAVEGEGTKRGLLKQFIEKYVDSVAEGAGQATITLAGMGLRALLGLS